MKIFALIAIITVTLWASPESVNFYKKSDKNKLLCKFTSTSYKVIHKKNSTIKYINSIEFFKLNNENLYINSSSCHPIKKEGTAIIF